jgi:uncharacterized protein (DUF1810 family)
VDDDPFDLQRFVAAQAGVYARVLEELRRGAKTSHWMWFVFPQLRELGQSVMAKRYGIAGLAEAQAYARHPVLGPRLVECTALVLAIPDRSVSQVFGSPDDVKFRSSMTLFERAMPDKACFGEALDRCLAGVRDPRTLALL